MPRRSRRQSFRPGSGPSRWSLASLEPRLMLAADAGVAAAAPISGSVAAETVASKVDATSRSSCEHLVLIDSEITDLSQWESALPEAAEIAVLQPGADPIDQISQILSQRRDVRSLHIISHGSVGQIRLAGQSIDQQTLTTQQEQIRHWRSAFAYDADLLLYGCDVAGGPEGKSFARLLSRLAGVDVAASDDATGNTSENLAVADWDLEFTVGDVRFAALLNRQALSGIREHLGIEIWAAGETTDELMELEIDGQVVDSWFVRDTNANDGTFLPYYYNVDGVSPDQIRINFVNDFYDAASGTDRNLRVDKIVVDGLTYETEAPSVFSTGTWQPDTGVTPGNRQSEYLTNNGYFQFASDGGGTSTITTIEIDAFGETGDEAMQLVVKDEVVWTYLNVPTSGTTYSYDYYGDVAPSDVRVAFIGAVYQPEFGYDQNLRVDRIRIDGESFESESASTYSTGTYVNGQGIIPGNWRSDILHDNGYFQYDYGGGNPGNGEQGSFALGTGGESVDESNGSVTVTIERIGGTDGTATIEYFTADDTAIAGQDYAAVSGQLTFFTGETSKQVTIPIYNDGQAESTESFSIRLNNPNGAGLLAPRTAVIQILDDDSNLPLYASFDSANGLDLNGNAVVTGGSLQLTAATAQQRGSAYYTTAIPISEGTSFQTSFTARFTGGQGSAGGEGLAFVIQNSPAGTSAQNIGNYSGGLDYNAVPNSLAVELDTFKNVYETYADEITIVKDGLPVYPLANIQSPYDLNDGTEKYVWVDYNGDSNVLAVYLSETSEKPDFAILKTTVDLAATVGDQAYVGFAGSTGTAFNNTYIDSWTFTLDTPAADPPTYPTGTPTELALYSGLDQPVSLEWSNDGRNLYIAEKPGRVKVVRDGGAVTTVIDIADRVNDFQDRGLIDIAVHPDFQSNGYLYLLYTVDPPEVYENVGNIYAGPDGQGNRAGQLIRVTLDASTGFTSVVPGSEVTLLGSQSTWNNFNAFTDSTLNFGEPPAGQNPDGSYINDFINSDSRSHTVGSLEFGIDGNLFVSIGDGASFNQTDVRAFRVQDPDSLSGKVLRIDPYTGQGLSDNPFYNGNPDDNRSKVYQLGLRNPWRLAVDPDTGRLFIGETGLSNFEEINTGDPGTNFGWPAYEGGQGTNRPTPTYQNLAQSQAIYSSVYATPALIAIPHGTGPNVVVVGDVATELVYGPQYDGDLFYNDFGRGIVSHADVSADGTLLGSSVFATGAEWITDIKQGVDGKLYYADLVNGVVGRWEIA
ncbi:DUF4347 domain-containing protein [Crateriforma conspicua]|uniref:DUF4347 domain-containing protein n=1 Tax=Crateriforma conspicua TaxID=2527996 RepID=UPI0011AA468B|nr:DUF4347 domain-containing protein [Crateriforma conspicua]